VPIGGAERLEKWPQLKNRVVEVSGKYANEAAADLVLSSAGKFRSISEDYHMALIKEQ